MKHSGETANTTIYAADLFCGAGGFTTGLLQAADHLGLTVNLLAVNHWATAIETHSRNHPGVTHYCETIEGVDPRKAVPGGHLDILMASPSCTHHSNARGGKPMSDQERSTAWHVLRWAEELYIENIIVENVREFRDWGPLHGCTCGLGDAANIYGPHTKDCKRGRPIKAMKGRLYRQFLSSLRALGYTVDERILNAADFGGATTRQRLFIQAKRGRKRPSWPMPTHLKPGSDGLGLLDDYPKWRAAREIIDWDVPSQSIYRRSKPLVPNTMARIMAGLHKYSGLPFIIGQQSCAAPRSTDDPLPTVATAGAISLIESFLIGAGGPSGAGNPQSLDEPLGTVLAENHRCLIQPFLVVLQNNRDAVSLNKPLPTVLTSGAHFGVAESFLVVNRTHSDARSLDSPVPTLTTGGNMAVVESFLVEMGDSACPPFLTEFHGGPNGANRTRSIDEPVCTLDTSNRVGLAKPFLVSYYGEGEALSLDEPLDTVTARDRFALVDPQLVTDGMVDKGQVVGWLDIRFRMLQPHELAAAMSFPSDYHFAGNREARVKQIGNAVEVQTAKALCLAALSAQKGAPHA